MPTKSVNRPGPYFWADPKKCIACQKCVRDCVTRIIEMENDVAVVKPENRDGCIACQHCLAICPTGAVMVAGCDPTNSEPAGSLSLDSLDLFFRSRRSFRIFAPESVDPELLARIVRAASYAPVGTNSRHRRLTVISDQAVLAQFRDRATKALVEKADSVPERFAWLVDAAQGWLETGRDKIFRNAPHLIVATAGPGASTPVADCLIALSYFELAAQSAGVGTVWCGMVEYILELIPEARSWLNIPEDHTLGYAMLFGRAGVEYARTAQYLPEDANMVKNLH